MFAELLVAPWPTVVVLFGLIEIALTIFVLSMILSIKSESTSAVAWCLTVVFLPILGVLLFFLFGYQSVQRPLKRKKKHRKAYRGKRDDSAQEAHADATTAIDSHWSGLARYAMRAEAFPLTVGNQVVFYHDGAPAYEAMLQAIEAAHHHIHIEFFIFRPDASGTRFIDALVRKANAGVEVRLLYDAVGAHDLSRRLLRQLREAGGHSAAFLSLLNPFRRFQINLRNHRKLVVVDGRIAFTGGLNIGDEYLGLHPKFGHWRDTFYRLEGPAVTHLQETFTEDWDFCAHQSLQGANYFPALPSTGESRVQIVRSGPDQEVNSLRQIYFATLLKARKRIWLATPYFVPDAPLREALVLAGRYGLDVRLLIPFRPDKWVPFLAGRYYAAEMLAAGVKVYQYTRGFMHMKMMLVDDGFACVGSANFDNRSLYLNFELNGLFYTPATIAELEKQFLDDLAGSVRIDPAVFAQRPYFGKVAENASRLFSPVL